MVPMGSLRYEGKAKKVYETTSPGQVIVSYKDDATAFNGEKKGTIVGKGSINNRMSNVLFGLLEEHGIPTHFIEQLSDRESLVHSVAIVPLEVVVRNLAAGSMAKRLRIPEGTELGRPIVELYYKDDALGDPLVTEDHAVVLGFATPGELQVMREMALRVNDILKRFFAERGVILVDFKLEFGKDADGQIRLADEISPDTCRFWDAQTRTKLDKDRFRRDLGNVEQAYEEIFKRVTEGQR